MTPAPTHAHAYILLYNKMYQLIFCFPDCFLMGMDVHFSELAET